MELIPQKAKQRMAFTPAAIPHLKSYVNTHDMVWELTFESDTDMRPAVFDFAHDNGLKTLQLNLKNKNLETVFREMTKKK